jgi:hypothetical protein
LLCSLLFPQNRYPAQGSHAWLEVISMVKPSIENSKSARWQNNSIEKNNIRYNATTLWVDKETRLHLEEYKRVYRHRNFDQTIKRLMANTIELRRLKKEAEA